MAAEEDNFDIDIYGDGQDEGEGGAEGEGEMEDDEGMDYKDEDDEHEFTVDEAEIEPQTYNKPEIKSEHTAQSMPKPPEAPASMRAARQPGDTGATYDDTKSASQQAVKSRESSDTRPVDHGATHALMLSDLHWWTTEDDIRGWINSAEAEDDLREITFNEHKVNGKSKGQVYLEFSTSQASTAVKRKIGSLNGDQHSNRKFSVVFTSASQNPFKTLPKDAPTRAKDERLPRTGPPAYNTGNPVQSNYSSNHAGFRGGRGGGFNRGGYNNNNNNNNQGHYNRNFSGPAGGFNNGGFQNNMGMMNSYNNFNPAGMMGGNMRGMGGMRGGRGGMNMMNNMNNFGGMGMGMGNMQMNPMVAGMGMQGYQGNQFNPAMFNPGPNFGGGDWNQHGVKRQRQE